MPKSRFVLHLLCCLAALPLWADAVADIADLLKKGDAKAALERSDDALARSPRDMRLRFLRGVALAEQGRQPEAIQVFSALTVDHPNQPEAYNNLAVLYAQQGQLDKARAALQMAIQTNPAYATAQANLSDVYAKLAAQAYDKALPLDKAAPTPPTPPRLALVKDLYTGPGLAKAGNTGVVTSSSKSVPVRVVKPSDMVAPVVAPVVAPNVIPTVAPTPVPTSAAAPTPVRSVAAAGPTPVASKPAATPVPTSPALVRPVATPAPLVAAAKVDPALAVPGKTAEAKSAEVKPAAGAVPDDEAQINAMLQSWAQAWAGKRVADYLGFYAKQFRTPKGMSRGAWEQQRRERIEGVRKIEVRVSNVKVQLENGVANVRFVQHYRSDRLESSTGKTLRLERIGGHWLIVDERVG